MAKRKPSKYRPTYIYPRPTTPLGNVEILHLDTGEVAVVSSGAVRYRAVNVMEAKAWAWDNRGDL